MKIRNSNFELMRIVSMLMIVMCHTLGHGGLINNSQNQTLSFEENEELQDKVFRR